MAQHSKAGIAAQMCSPDVVREPRALWGASILCGVTGACFSAFPCSPPTSILLGKAGLACVHGGTAGQGGEEGWREGGTEDGGPRSRAAQRDSSTPVPSPAVLSHCSWLLWRVTEKGGRCPLTSLGKMQWRWHSAPCFDLPAGQQEPGTARVHICWSLELLLTFAWVSPWLRAMASDGAAACHYHHSGYNHHLLLFSSTDRHNRHKY